ncbi:hypothetical protein LzC2_03120 [Planctomycetes bacterium LzC2]|uniref:Uncharacterized protein n=2 Tax=Alienimonas chondri TaxID=2681879 RepID=A0ABX1V9S3_9PLAN|nr:hypothetical protein [Alienimonas chondri]
MADAPRTVPFAESPTDDDGAHAVRYAGHFDPLPELTPAPEPLKATPVAPGHGRDRSGSVDAF